MSNLWKSEAIFAAENQNLDKLKELLVEDNTRNFNFTDDKGFNLLHFSSLKRSANTLPLIQWLLEKEIDPMALNENFESAMDLAKKQSNIPALTLMKYAVDLRNKEIQDYL